MKTNDKEEFIMNFSYGLDVEPKQSIFDKIKLAVVYFVLAEVPPCGGKRDDWNGEFDCTYDPDFDCEHCVCLYFARGQRKGFDPRTGKKFKKLRKYFSRKEAGQ